MSSSNVNKNFKDALDSASSHISSSLQGRHFERIDLTNAINSVSKILENTFNINKKNPNLGKHSQRISSETNNVNSHLKT